jgi:hypothetical protein
MKQTAEHIWLVSFMEYDLRYFDDETCRLEPIEDPFGPRLSPMSPEWTERRLAPQVGFEPTTLRLTAGCSTIELLRNVGGLVRKTEP